MYGEGYPRAQAYLCECTGEIARNGDPLGEMLVEYDDAGPLWTSFGESVIIRNIVVDLSLTERDLNSGEPCKGGVFCWSHWRKAHVGHGWRRVEPAEGVMHRNSSLFSKKRLLMLH